MRIIKVLRPKKEQIEAIRPRKTNKEVYADNLRENPTESEMLMCQLLDKMGIKYKFQHIICGYIPDFYIPKGKIILELDGAIHREFVAYDTKKDKVFRKHGYRVLRIPSRNMFVNVQDVINKLETFVLHKKNPTPKKPQTKLNKKQIREFKESPDDNLENFLFFTQGL